MKSKVAIYSSGYRSLKLMEFQNYPCQKVIVPSRKMRKEGGGISQISPHVAQMKNPATENGNVMW